MTFEQALRTLELPSGASWTQVREAYRDLLMVWHPDRFTAQSHVRERATAKTQDIITAYTFLKTHYPESGVESAAYCKKTTSQPESSSHEPEQTKRNPRKWSKPGFTRAPFASAASLMVFAFVYLPGIALVTFLSSFAGRIAASAVFTVGLFGAVSGQISRLPELPFPQIVAMLGGTQGARDSSPQILRVGAEYYAQMFKGAISQAVDAGLPNFSCGAEHYRFITPPLPRVAPLILERGNIRNI